MIDSDYKIFKVLFLNFLEKKLNKIGPQQNKNIRKCNKG
jgi:hypothetical protein